MQEFYDCLGGIGRGDSEDQNPLRSSKFFIMLASCEIESPGIVSQVEVHCAYLRSQENGGKEAETDRRASDRALPRTYTGMGLLYNLRSAFSTLILDSHLTPPCQLCRDAGGTGFHHTFSWWDPPIPACN